MIYVLWDEGAWARAIWERSLWGVLYVDASFLDDDHVARTFRPASDRRWSAWEQVRKSWILEWAA
jgi:hypothetical protein